MLKHTKSIIQSLALIYFNTKLFQGGDPLAWETWGIEISENNVAPEGAKLLRNHYRAAALTPAN